MLSHPTTGAVYYKNIIPESTLLLTTYEYIQYANNFMSSLPKTIHSQGILDQSSSTLQEFQLV